MSFKLSLFQSVGDTRPERVEHTWAQLCKRFAAPRIRQEKDGLLFSPAIYASGRPHTHRMPDGTKRSCVEACRRMQNVIELSLLVLEVDGAWQCVTCGFKAPLILFRNRKHEGDRCPECKKRNKKLERSEIKQIEFGLPELIADVRQAVGSAFAIYSTHSHKRITPSSPVAEPRFRIVVPLSEPIPVARFRELWQWAVESLKTIPADPQDKDPNRIYYTPVKSSETAVYEFHIEPGEPLNWREVVDSEQQTANSSALSTQHLALSTDGFATHEDRHEELCRRIMARGKQNSQGNWDAKCLAHGGRGNTALCYFPNTGAVKCNRGCDYLGPGGILDAEGLSFDPLPSRDRLSAVRTASVADGDLKNFWTATSAAKLHSIYSLLLGIYFVLTAQDETAIRRDWKINPYGEEAVQLPDGLPTAHSPLHTVIKHCSMPSLIEQATACRELLRLGFDLRGVPGFYLINPRAVPGEPTRASQVEQWASDEFGPWRLNLPYRKGLLVGYTNGTGYVLGIKIYRSTKDPNPFLLTSRGLPGGTSAVAVKESVAA